MPLNTNRWNRLRYSLWAPFYDPVVWAIGKGRRRALALLRVEAGERVLIDGCGTGLDLELLPRGAVITAVDLTPAMVERTRARAGELGMPVDARVMDAGRLEFPDASFDCVLLHLILAIVPDPVAAAREAARVLRPGGRASIFDKFLPDGARPSLLRRAANLVTNALATDINRHLPPILDAAGLHVVQEEPSVFGGRFRVVIVGKRGARNTEHGTTAAN